MKAVPIPNYAGINFHDNQLMLPSNLFKPSARPDGHIFAGSTLPQLIDKPFSISVSLGTVTVRYRTDLSKTAVTFNYVTQPHREEILSRLFVIRLSAKKRKIAILMHDVVYRARILKDMAADEHS